MHMYENIVGSETRSSIRESTQRPHGILSPSSWCAVRDGALVPVWKNAAPRCSSTSSCVVQVADMGYQGGRGLRGGGGRGVAMAIQ